MIIQKYNCGFALQSSESTSASAGSIQYPHAFTGDAIDIKTEHIEITTPTVNGPVQCVTGKEISTLSNTVMHVNGLEKPFYIAAGFTSATSGSNTVFTLGAPISAGINAGRTSISSITVMQYNGIEANYLYNAKPYNFTMDFPAGQIVELKQNFQGTGVKTATSAFGSIKTVNTNTPMKAIGQTVTINGTAVKYSTASLDLGIEIQQVDDASTATALGDIDIIKYAPVFTINPLNTSVTRSFFDTVKTNTVYPISLTGSSNGKTYIISFLAYLSENTSTYDNQVNIQNHTWKIIADTDLSLIKISIAN